MKKFIKSSAFVLITITLLIATILTKKVSVANAQSEPVTYIKTAEELKDAIVRKQATIFVDDITFDTPETILINHSVKLVGKSEKSTIKNLHIQVQGSSQFENRIKLSLENVIFDGCFDKTAYDLTQEKPFDELLGIENDNGFLWVDAKYIGYYDIDIDNCEFTNYSGWWGAVMYLPWNDSENGEKLVNIKNSKFYGNVGVERIVEASDRQLRLNIENVEMFDNYVVSKVANFSNVALNVNGLNIHDNHFVPFDSAEYFAQLNDRNMIRGGGIYIGNSRGLVKNMTVENNETYYGGGMFIALSWDGNQKLTFADCFFKNNQARINGGAVGVESYVGYPVYFVNCQFIGNTAPKGGSICAMPFIGDRANGNTSYIEFSFCDFSGNVADDEKALAYYYDGFTKTKKDGKIIVKACRIEDATFLTGNGEKENNYNIVSPTAITDNQDIQVPCEEYTLWANGYYNGKTEQRTIGYVEPTIPMPQNEKISIVQPIFYGICALGSIIIALIYLFKSKEKHIEMIFISVAVALINIGYLLLSVSRNLTSALLFNNVAYLGNAFLPLFFMMAVANVCRFKVNNISKIILSAITVINFLFTLTVWFSGLFYLEPTYAIINGAVDIAKRNGILHLIYRLYVFAYFFVIFGIVLYSIIKNKLEHKKYGILIFSAELVCLIVWTIEMFVSINFELLSLVYMLTSLLLSVLFFEMEKYGILTSISEIIVDINEQNERASEDNQVSQNNDEGIGINGIEKVCNMLVEQKILSKRETEILALIIQDKNSSNIEETLYISKNTVKYHIKNIYAKLSVRSREELRARIANELQRLG